MFCHEEWLPSLTIKLAPSSLFIALLCMVMVVVVVAVVIEEKTILLAVKVAFVGYPHQHLGGVERA